MKRAVIAALVLATMAGACRRKPEATNINAQNRVAVRPAHFYYESPQMLLVRETRNVPLPESASAALPEVMRELFKGPSNAALGRLLPADTTVRGAYLLPDGTAIVDLGGATLSAGWPTGSHQELMAVYSIVETAMANFSEIRRVRLLINGTPAETLAGHISLGKPLTPLRTLVQPAAR